MNIQLYAQAQIIPYLQLMNTWCSRHFRQYPYFYIPAEQQIIHPSDVMYVNDHNALLVVTEMEKNIISIATGIPLDSSYLTSYYFSPVIIDKFKANHFDPKKIWYMGYFLIAPEYRQHTQLINSIYEKFVTHAKKLGKTQLSYVNILSAENDPRKPNNYLYLEPWGDIITGFSNSNVTTQATWPTLQADNSVKDQTHEIGFFVKGL